VKKAGTDSLRGSQAQQQKGRQKALSRSNTEPRDGSKKAIVARLPHRN
jgi:hypothetical protein